MHSADGHVGVGFHLFVDFLLIVGNEVQLTLKLAYCAKGTHLRLVALHSSQIESAAVLQILVDFLHGKNHPFI